MMRLPLVITLGLLAAACSGGAGNSSDRAETAGMNEEQLSQLDHRAPDPEKVMAERWGAMFAQPSATIAAINEFGYAIAPLAPTGGNPAFGARAEVLLPDAKAPITVRTSAAIAGPAGDKLDKIEFDFDIDYQRAPADKDERDILRIPVRIIQGFTSRFAVGLPDELRTTFSNGGTASLNKHGVTIAIAADPRLGDKTKKGAKRHIRVTLTHGTATTTATTS
jgi:hypothetical protein